MSNIRFVNRGKRGEIWLYDQVGEGFFGGMSAKQFTKDLIALGQVDTINLRINSPGGSVFDGMAIYNALKRHPARIEVDVDGIAASIASVIAMSGDTINMAANSMMMIHDPHGFTMGGATEMRKTADLLDQIKGLIVDTYSARTGQADAKLIELMAAETWMTAIEAQDMGFADQITAEQRIAACAGFDFSQFRHAPAALTGATVGARSSMASVKVARMVQHVIS